MNKILDNLKKAILEYDSVGGQNMARDAIKEGIDPIKALDALTEGIREVGEGYNAGRLWLPDLIAAASAMTKIVPILEEEIRKVGKKRKYCGSVVIGTVFGDVHSIGKAMVSTLLTANGFEVIDLGVNIPAEGFIKAINEHRPDILAMSALLTTTAPEMRKVIQSLKDFGLEDKVKTMVGGGAITAEFALSVGADGYAPTATLAVDVFKELANKVKEG